MIRRVVLRNYMAHTLTELELVDGLNVLVGPNNCGKSAVISALHLLATVPTREGSYMVRHGAKECSVTVETKEGDVLCWKRGRAGSPKLEINGEELSRLANDQAHALDRLQPLLRLPKVRSLDGKDAFDVHFALQKEPIFLLNSESAAATFFASSSDANRLLEMQSKFKQRVRAKKQEKKDAEEQLEHLALSLQKLEPLDQLKPLMEAAQRLYDELLLSHAKEKALAEDLERLNVAASRAEQFRREVTALNPLRPVPVLSDTAPLARDVEELRNAIVRVGRLTREVTAAEPLRVPPELIETRPMERLVESLALYRQRVGKLVQEHRVLKPLNEPPQLSATEPLERLIAQLVSIRKRTARLAKETKTLAPVQDPPALPEEAPLAEHLRRLDTMTQKVALLRRRQEALESLRPPEIPAETETLRKDRDTLLKAMKSVDSATSALSNADRELEEWFAENPNCPTCGKPFDSAEKGGRHVHST